MKKLHYETFKNNRFMPKIITNPDWSKIYFADLETTTTKTEYFKVYNKTTIHFGYIENAQDGSGFLFKTLNQLFEFLNKRRRQHLIVYFHNLGFDGTYILSFLDALKKHHAVNKVSNKQPFPSVSFMKKDSRIYSIRVWNPTYETVIEFRCSWVLLNMKLEAIGKIIGLEKMGFNDYHLEYQKDLKDYPQEFKDYCIRDVQVLKMGFKHFYNLFKEEYNIDLFNGCTISQLSYENLLQHVLQKHDWYYDNEFYEEQMDEFIHIDKASYDIGKNFYRGGFTQYVNLGGGQYIINCNKKGRKIDINSSYPYAMTKPLPYGQIHNLKDEPFPDSPHLKYYEIKILKSRAIFKQINTMYNWAKHSTEDVYVNDIASSYIYKEEYSQELGECTAYYLEEELEVMKKYNYIEYEIINTYWFHAKPWAKEWVEDLYQLKADPNTPKALKQVGKLMMNSCYGKFGQNPLQDEYYAVKNNEEKQKLLNQKDNEYHYWDIQEPFEHFQYVKRRKMDVDDDQRIRHIWVAATITAYARIHLLKTLYHIGVEYFVYCDTDSLILLDPMDWDILPFLDESELGKWKDESQEHGGIDKVYLVGKKNYGVIYNDGEKERKFSGVSNDYVKNMSDEEYEAVCRGEVKILKNAKTTHDWKVGGMMIEEVDYNMNPRTH